MATREQVFGSRECSLLVQTYLDNSRNHAFTDLFDKGSYIESWDPNHVEFDKTQYLEMLAPFVSRNDAPPVMQKPTDTNEIARMAKIAHTIPISGDKLFFERNPGSMVPDAQAQMDKVLKQGMKYMQNSIELLCAFALLDTLVINSTVVPGSKVAFGTNGSIGNDTIDASDWSNVATLIATQKVKAICDQYRQNAGLLPSQLWLNSTTEGYLLENTEIQTLLRSFPGAYAILQSSHKGVQVMNGLGIGDLAWSKHLGGYKKDGSTWSDYMPTDKAIILPEDAALPGVLAMAEGYNLLPSKLWGTGADVTQQLVRAPKPGVSVYTELMSKPWRVDVTFEWTGIPIVLHPKGVLVASV